MRKVLIELARAIHRMAGPGAIANAKLEVLRAESSVEELDAQLRHVSSPTPRRAA